MKNVTFLKVVLGKGRAAEDERTSVQSFPEHRWSTFCCPYSSALITALLPDPHDPVVAIQA
jgi:hypothetical protein